MLSLRVPEHQVAGHKAKDGILGPLIDDSGKFYKPLQSDERGSNELAFYTSLSSNPNIPKNILPFFPVFHGTQTVNASDGSGLHPHIVLDDIVSGYKNPSVIDIKIGSRTWYPQASEDYIRKCLQKDRESSTLPLGFRISGLRSVGPSLYQPHKHFLQNLSAEDALVILKKFVSFDGNSSVPDCVFAVRVFGPVLEQLLEIKKWFEVQTLFHFYSCSVLVVYEKEEGKKGDDARAVVKLVDFAHLVDSKGAIDHNFLGGLCSLIKFVKDVLAAVSKEEH